jgi:hypothetical protein
MRMLRAARREIEVYDRNRESLYALRDGDLRVHIHTLIVRLTMPLDGLLETDAEADALRVAHKNAGADPARREEIEAEQARLQGLRDQSFDFVTRTSEQFSRLILGLSRIARHDFDRYDAASGGDGVTAPARPPRRRG